MSAQPPGLTPPGKNPPPEPPAQHVRAAGGQPDLRALLAVLLEIRDEFRAFRLALAMSPLQIPVFDPADAKASSVE